MLIILLKTYAFLFLSLGALSCVIFFFGLKLIFKTFRPKIKTEKTQPQIEAKERLVVSSADIKAITGDDDTHATQLDLARAYVEIGNFKLAKKILAQVSESGTHLQRQEAQRWLNDL